MRVEGVAGRVELLFPAEYLGDKRTAFGQQFLVTLCQSPAQNGKATVTVRINKTAVSPYDDGFQLEMSPVAISNSWKTIKVIDQMLVSGGVVSSEDQLRRVLANISDITLVAVGDGDITIDILTVHLDYATPTVLANGIADYVETCQCPPGCHGQFCEDCSPEYARDSPNGGPFVKCYCSNKATSCDPETGRCHNCTNNTGGDHCEHCTDGYYRNMTTGECLPCSCPGQLGGITILPLPVLLLTTTI
ncbi:laminin subunit gamma-3-like isoform X2 [Dysidea avara]|uniref:laminin subunit gamma-3-like isoform X2 n=1 Tax=Dysidea avara TaxID=196820 RepID=UPI003328090C